MCNYASTGKSSSKTFLAKTEDTVSESVYSSKTISFSFFEIIQAAGVLVEVPSILTFKSASIFSTMQEF